MKTKLFLFLVLFGLFITNVQGQQSVHSSGGNATGSGGTSSYSVGQLTYHSYSGSNGSINEGVQVPFEIITLGKDSFPDIKLMMVYPNPTTNMVTLKTGNYIAETLEYQLYDLNGKKIASQKITQAETQIPFENLTSSIYFLKVMGDNKLLKTFRIIKN